MTNVIVDVQPIVDPKLGIVAVDIIAEVDGHIVDATGSAKVHAPDTFDPSVGLSLATARALKELSKNLNRNANREIRRRDRQRLENEARAKQLRAERRKKAKEVRKKLGIK